MAKKFKIYTDSSFLENICQQAASYDVYAEKDDQDVFRHFLLFIREQSEVELSIDSDLNDLVYGPAAGLLIYFRDKYFQSNEGIAIKAKKNDIFTNNDISATLLNEKKSVYIFCDSIPDTIDPEADWGIVTTKSVNFTEKWKNFMHGRTYIITKNHGIINRLLNWNQLRHQAMPLNALIIQDPYLAQNQYHLPNNIFPLLRQFLSKAAQKNIIDITIICHDESIFNLNLLHNTIKDFLQNEYPSNQFNISIIVPKDKIHGRYIFTPYQWWISDHSFSYFNRNGNTILPADATLRMIPASNISEDMDTFLRITSNNIINPAYCIGSNSNRLYRN